MHPRIAIALVGLVVAAFVVVAFAMGKLPPDAPMTAGPMEFPK